MEKAQIAQLVTKARDGDGAAFEALYRLTNQQAYFVARKLARTEEDALDILQDSYVKALSGLSKLENPESFCGWFNRIVANTGKDYLVKSGFVLFDGEENEAAALNSLADEDGDFMPEESLDTRERRERVMDIIDGLPEDKRLCVLLYYYDGMSAPDIARALDISEGTVKSRLHDARGKIKSSIEKLERQGVKLFGAAPLSCFRWILERCTPYAELSAENSEKVLDALKGAAVLAGGAVLAGSAAGAGAAGAAGGAAAGAAGGTAAAIGGIAGTAAKIAAAITVPKLVATAAAAAVIVGGAVGGAEIVKHNVEKSETQAVAAGATVMPTAGELLTGLLAEESATLADATEPEIATGEVQVVTAGHGTGAESAASTSGQGAQTGTAKTTAVSTAKTTTTKAATTATAKASTTTTKVSTATTKASTTTTKPLTTTTKANTTTTNPATTTTKASTTTTKVSTTTTTTTTAPSSDFTYSVSGGSATVSGYTGGGTSVSIPAVLGGATVEAIGSYAFEDSGITSVSMPSALKTIGNGAFGNCTSLSGVSFSGGLKSIGIGAFQNCPSLTVLTLPSGLESIGASGFEGCSGLTSVTVPASVTGIGAGAFDGCPNLTIRCASGSAAHSYATANGIYFVLL